MDPFRRRFAHHVTHAAQEGFNRPVHCARMSTVRPEPVQGILVEERGTEVRLRVQVCHEQPLANVRVHSGQVVDE